MIDKIQIYSNIEKYGIKKLEEDNSNESSINLHCEEFNTGKLNAKKIDDTYILSIKLSCKQMPYGFAKTFEKDKCVIIKVPIEDNICGILGCKCYHRSTQKLQS